MKKVVLAFSGGLDTSYCAIKLREEEYEPICVCVDVGQDIDEVELQAKAEELNISDLRIVDAKEDFVSLFIAPSIWANALYQDVYPLSTALTRPLIAKIMVTVAEEANTCYLAHGCTGKGNDQIRLEVAIKLLLPKAQILAPIRENNLSRDETLEFLSTKGIHLGITRENPYSIDENLWGRSICAGVLEDLEEEVPETIYEWTSSPQDAPAAGEVLVVEYDKGLPISINGERSSLLSIIRTLNRVAGKHGIGRIDHVEDRLVGIKSREIYETPAAITILHTHRMLESLTLTRHAIEFKRKLETEYAKLLYGGGWFTPHHFDLLAYLRHNQRVVTGRIKVQLIKGNIIALSREAELSLYDKNLASYGPGSLFEQQAAEGFINILSLESSISAKSHLLGRQEDLALLPQNPQKDDD